MTNVPKPMTFYDVVIPSHIPADQKHRYATRIVKGSYKKYKAMERKRGADGKESKEETN